MSLSLSFPENKLGDFIREVNTIIWSLIHPDTRENKTPQVMTNTIKKMIKTDQKTTLLFNKMVVTSSDG